MSTLKMLRSALGLTQQQLADYLGVSRGHLSLAELGHRQLPSTASLKIAQIERHRLHNTSARLSDVLQLQSAKGKKLLADQERQHTQLAEKTRLRLEQLRKEYENCLRTLQVTSGVLADIDIQPSSKKERLFMELLHENTLKKIEACGLHAQALLQLEADVHRYHAHQAKSIKI